MEDSSTPNLSGKTPLDDLKSETLHLKCPEGKDISFDCPCCPEEFDDCRFKKLFKGGYIVRDSKLYGHHRFELDEQKTNVILRECNEDDEGTYLWMCGKCNVNKEFHLEIQKPPNQSNNILRRDNLTGISLKCPNGSDASFECPCCAEGLDSCRFERPKHEGYIIRNGLLKHNHPRFKFSGDKTQIILKGCHNDDRGLYVWKCEKCNATMEFTLNVMYGGRNNLETSSTVAHLVLYATTNHLTAPAKNVVSLFRMLWLSVATGRL